MSDWWKHLDGPGADFDPACLAAYIEKLKVNDRKPPLELVGPTEYFRRQRRHRDGGVAPHVWYRAGAEEA